MSTRKYSRRQFIPMFFEELFVAAKAAKGRPAFQLNDLANLPEDYFNTIIPMINPAYQICVVDGQICSQLKSEPDAEPLVHFAKTPENLAVFNRINGKNSIQEIAELCADEWQCDINIAYQHTRQIFLYLAQSRVAVPKNELDWEVAFSSYRSDDDDT